MLSSPLSQFRTFLFTFFRFKLPYKIKIHVVKNRIVSIFQRYCAVFFFFFGKQQGVTLLKAIRCITTRWFLDHFLLITNVTNVKTQHFYNFYLKLRKLRNGKVRISTSKSSQKKTLIESSWSQYQFDMHQLWLAYHHNVIFWYNKYNIKRTTLRITTG